MADKDLIKSSISTTGQFFLTHLAPLFPIHDYISLKSQDWITLRSVTQGLPIQPPDSDCHIVIPGFPLTGYELRHAIYLPCVLLSSPVNGDAGNNSSYFIVSL